MLWLAAMATMIGMAAQSELKVVQVATKDGARIAIKRKPAAMRDPSAFDRIVELAKANAPAAA